MLLNTLFLFLSLLSNWSAIDVTEVEVWIESSRLRFFPVDEMRKIIFTLSTDRLPRLTSVRSNLPVDWSKRILFFLFELNQLFVFSSFFTVLFVCCGYTHNFPSTPLVFEWGREKKKEEKTLFLLSVSLCIVTLVTDSTSRFLLVYQKTKQCLLFLSLFFPDWTMLSPLQTSSTMVRLDAVLCDVEFHPIDF